MSFPIRIRNVDRDYLKFFGIIKDFIARRYGIDEKVLHTMMFLYSERYFTRREFEEMRKALTTSKSYFEKMKRDGLIHLFADARDGRKAKTYELSHRGRAIMKSFYDKIEGRARLPETATNSPYIKHDPTDYERYLRSYMSYINRRLKNKRDMLSDID